MGANRDDHSGITDAGSAYIFEDIPVVGDDGPVPAISNRGLPTAVLLVLTVSTAVLFRRRRTAT